MDTDTAHLPRDKRIELAKVSGAVQSVAFGVHRELPLAEKIAALHQITADPVVLGFALGNARASVELDGFELFGQAAELLIQAGADGQVAAEVLAAVREEFERKGHR